MAAKTVTELFRLDGRRAVVTGGARGLGRTIAEALAQAGANVVIASRTLSDCQAAAEEIAASTGRRTWAFVVDVANSSQIERCAQEVSSVFGPVDILVNNAGVNIRGAAADLSEADWDTVITTNLKAPFLCARAFAPAMCERGLVNDPAQYKIFVEKIPMGRWGELHEIAGAAVFLASDAASFITGSALFVDGGWTAQ